MHPQDVFPNQRQCPEPLLPHSTGENLGRQHLFPCSSPTQSLCLHFTGKGNNNLKKKKKALPKLQVSLLASIFASSRQGGQGRAGVFGHSSSCALGTLCPVSAEDTWASARAKGTATAQGPLRGSALPLYVLNTAEHTGHLQLGAVLPRGCSSAALTPA